MFLRVLHLSVVMALLFQQCQLAVVCLLFKIEQPYLSKNVCEKRNDPKSICKAHCQLLNIVRHQDEQQQQSKLPMKGEAEKEFTILFHQPNITLHLLIAPDLVKGVLIRGFLQVGYTNIPVQPPETILRYYPVLSSNNDLLKKATII